MNNEKENDWVPELVMEGSEFYSFVRSEFRNLVQRHLSLDDVTKIPYTGGYTIFGFAAILDEMASLMFNEIKDEEDAEAAKEALVGMAKFAVEKFIINKSILQ
jgi:hypothetical protein